MMIPDEPMDDQPDIICWRDRRGMARVTLPQTILYHASTFEWGYRGSGPSDLGLNILSHYVDWQTALALHGAFTAEVIARMPHVGGTIRAADVRAWIAGRRYRMEVVA